MFDYLRYRIPRELTRHKSSIRKRLGLPHGLDELDVELVTRPLLFRAPPFDERLVTSIRRISPQFRLRPDDRSRRFWERAQNSSCWGEHDALAPLFAAKVPNRVLDIGPGMGRSAVFFKQASGWQEVPFDLFEGDGATTTYTKHGPRVADSFCGDIAALERVLAYNQVAHCHIHDAHEHDGSLAGLPGPYDFIYSFYAVGWHWSLFEFLDEIRALLSPSGFGAFTLHPTFDRVDELAVIPHRIVRFRRSWPRGEHSTRMLLIAHDETVLAPLDQHP